MSKTYLKVKIKSLASEAQIIRAEERKWKRRLPTYKFGNQPSPIYFGLHEHRICVVRRESRSALLAYGFIRHKSYRSIEQKNKQGHEPAQSWRIAELVSKYGIPSDWLPLKNNERAAKISEWICET